MSNKERHEEWRKWLSEEAPKFYTKFQLESAKKISIPKVFTDVPSAMKDSDENLCLTWRYLEWTLSIEVNPQGISEWWLGNTESREYFEDENEIKNLFDF